MKWQFQAPDAYEALSARQPFTAYLRSLCTPESDCNGAALVFNELVTNVIQHAPGPITISVQADPTGVVTLDVCDSGNGFNIEPSHPVSALAKHGRGLYIVSCLCEHLSTTRTSDGNKVSAVLPVLAKRSHLHLVKDDLV